jgi:hypothetical protein
LQTAVELRFSPLFGAALVLHREKRNKTDF